MSEILKLQHIKTKNELINALKARFDYDELLRVGHIIGLLESVKFEDTVSTEARADLAALAAKVEEWRVKAKRFEARTFSQESQAAAAAIDDCADELADLLEKP